MCSIDQHEKYPTSSVDDSGSFGGNVLLSNSRTEASVSISVTIDFIDCWLKWFDCKYLERFNMYIETMPDLFHKIPVQLPKPQSHK